MIRGIGASSVPLWIGVSTLVVLLGPLHHTSLPDSSVNTTVTPIERGGEMYRDTPPALSMGPPTLCNEEDASPLHCIPVPPYSRIRVPASTTPPACVACWKGSQCVCALQVLARIELLCHRHTKPKCFFFVAVSSLRCLAGRRTPSFPKAVGVPRLLCPPHTPPLSQ